MPHSNWRSNIAIAGGVAVGILLAFNYALLVAGAKYPCSEYAASQTQNAASNRLSTAGPPQQKTTETGIYETDCQKPKDHDAADLCEQRRMARAAEEAGCIARVQLWLSGLGIVLVLGSLYLSGWAAIAASQTAKEAGRAVDVHLSTEAPKLFIRDMKPRRGTLNWKASGVIVFDIENMGRTPAVLHYLNAKCLVSTSTPVEVVHSEQIGLSGIAIDKGDRHACYAYVVGDTKINVALDGMATAYLWGTILYEDIFGRRRLRGFGYKGTRNALLAGSDTDWLHWSPFGGAAYNYDEPEKDA